jgi:hypothetical protein
MAKIEVDVCDQCGKETKDFYANKGWIELTRGYDTIPDTHITVSMGRREKGDAKNSGFYSGKPLMFCSTDCLVNFISQLIRKAKKAEETYNKTG